MKVSKLGIVIPNWNGSKHLPAMLDSILAQTYKDWQAYIIDDCSTDASWSILTNYAERDNRINIFKRNRLPKGAQTCRNIGIELAKDSKYICFFDSDDILAPWCFEQRVSFMDNNPDVECGVFPAKSFTGDDLYTKKSLYFGYRIFNEDLLESFLYMPLPYVGWTNIYRMKSLIKYNLLWDERVLSKQDSDYNIQAIIKGINIRFAGNSKIDYYWRIEPQKTSITKKINSREHSGSHIYRMQKLLNSLTLETKINKERPLQKYLMENIVLACKFSSSSIASELFKDDFFKNNKLFTLKLKLLLLWLNHCHASERSIQRIKNHLFPSFSKTMKERYYIYDNFIKEIGL